MKICLNTHNLGARMTADELVSVSKAAGISGLEFSIGYGHDHGVEFDTPKDDLIRIRDMVLDAGLETVSIASYCRFDSDSSDEREKNLELAKKGIETAAAMKAGIFRFVGNDLPAHTPRDIFLGRIADVMSCLADYAAPSGVTALLQIHGSLSGAADVAEIARLCGRQNSGLVYNCGQEDVSSGSVDVYLDRISPFLRHIHMHCMLLDYPYGELFRIMKKTGYKGWYSITVDEPSAEPAKLIAYYARLAKAIYDNA